MLHITASIYHSLIRNFEVYAGTGSPVCSPDWNSGGAVPEGAAFGRRPSEWSDSGTVESGFTNQLFLSVGRLFFWVNCAPNSKKNWRNLTIRE